MILALAITPPLLIALLIYWKDHFEREQILPLALSFFWGCMSTIPAILGESSFQGLENPQNLWNVAIVAFVVVAMSEELSKFLFLRFYAYPRDFFNEPLDGIVYSVMVSMGFATVENIMYVLNTENAIGIAAGRALTAVPAHAAFGVLMGAFVGLAKFRPEKRGRYMFFGVFLAVFFHGLYDFFLLQKAYENMAILAIGALVLAILIARKLIHFGQDISPFNPKNENNNAPIMPANNDDFV
jgi:protease PrsW